MTPRISDQSGDVSALWPAWVWALLVAVAVAIAVLVFLAVKHDPAPEVQDDPEPTGCNEFRPHVMLPTDFGWRCANDCGESWWVDQSDELAQADFALWSIENNWGADA